jgi:hypothetical protein
MKKSLILLAVMVVMGGLASASFLGNFAVSPQGTFLLQSANDVCSEYNIPGCNMNPTFINLANSGINAGDSITISDYGSLCVNAGQNCTQYPASQFYLGAIFSTSNVLLGPSNQNRVAGAILPGMLTGSTLIGMNPNLNTQNGNQSTFTPDDFYVGATVVVPAGATYLIVGALDSAFADNSSPANSFGVTIFDPSSTVPEPSTYAFMLGGIGALLMLRRRSSSVV